MKDGMSIDMNKEAEAIVAAHQDKAIEVRGDITPNFSQDGEIYRTAKQAALALGFIESDAECVALAWQRQADRLGYFDARHWPDAPEDYGLAQREPAVPQAFPACPERLGLYAVLPDAAWVARMAQAGVPTLQLRFKSENPDAVRHEVEAAVQGVRGTNALLFINDHWQAALEAGAGHEGFLGVHLGQEDMDTLQAEDFAAIRSAGLRLGLSTHGYAEMLRAANLQPSYIAMGAVWATTLKAMPTAPQGPGRLAAYVRLIQAAGYPGVAIGGISATEVPVVKATGVGSFAVVRAITGAADPEQAARALMVTWNA